MGSWISSLLMFVLLLLIGVVVSASSLPVPPTPTGPEVGMISQIKTFSINASTDYPDVLLYQFSWGDDTYSEWLPYTSDGPLEESHSWAEIGRYQITVRCSDASDTTSEWSKAASITITQDSDQDGWTDAEEQLYGTNSLNTSDYPSDSDDDHLPDSTDSDDDNDGLDDVVETAFGSNPKSADDVLRLTVTEMDCYLIDSTQTGQYDLFYYPPHRVTSCEYDQQKGYLFDYDGDGRYDYQYDTSSQNLEAYHEETVDNIPWVFIISILGVIGVICLIVVVLFKIGFIRVEEEIVYED